MKGHANYDFSSNTGNEIIEAVANNSKDAHEIVSTEDLLAKTKIFNKRAEQRRKTWKRDRIRKIRCKKCQFEDKEEMKLDELAAESKSELRKNEMYPSLAVAELSGIKIEYIQEMVGEMEPSLAILEVKEVPCMPEGAASCLEGVGVTAHLSEIIQGVVTEMGPSLAILEEKGVPVKSGGDTQY